MSSRRSALRLTSLECRDCPALGISFLGGSLTVTGSPNAALAITGTGGTKLNVTDGATNFGTYAVTGNLNVQLARHVSTIDIDFNGQTLGGNLSIDLGTVGPNLAATPGVSVRDGAVGGSLAVRNGNGTESLTLGAADGTSPLTVGGDVQYVPRNSSAFNGDALLVGDGSVIGRNLLTQYVDLIDFGLGVGATPARIGGNLVVNNSGASLGVVLGLAGTVDGNATIVGSTGDDFVNVGTGVAGFGTVNGSLTAVLGEARSGNVFLLNSAATAGALSVISGGGDDFLSQEGDVFGSAVYNLGNGGNSLVFAGTVFGALTINGGNGNDDLFAFSGTVNGNLDINLGGGLNAFFFAGTVNGSRLTYTGGSGADSVFITGTNNFQLVANLGAGADALTFGTGDSVGAATIDFGIDSDVDSFTPPAVIDFPLTLRNYP